jgi:hypothetical protein
VLDRVDHKDIRVRAVVQLARMGQMVGGEGGLLALTRALGTGISYAGTAYRSSGLTYFVNQGYHERHSVQPRTAWIERRRKV